MRSRYRLLVYGSQYRPLTMIRQTPYIHRTEWPKLIFRSHP